MEEWETPRLAGEVKELIDREPESERAGLKARVMRRLSGKLGLSRLGGVLRATSRGLEDPRRALGPVRGIGVVVEPVAWLGRDGSPSIWPMRGDWRT